MTNRDVPLMSIGLPVYNGERFLRAALDSYLGQTLDDFELIISDNASTDSTAAICLEYAAHDHRVRYVRQPQNQGSIRNFNTTFKLSAAPYFRWAAADDVVEPTYLQATLDALRSDPHAALGHCRIDRIDEHGHHLGDENYHLGVESRWAAWRFLGLSCFNHSCFQIFGVVRREVLASTSLHLPHVGSDRNLLAEIALHGRFALVDDVLFHRRVHGASFSTGIRDRAAKREFNDPKGEVAQKAGDPMVEPYRAAVDRAPLTNIDRAVCRVVINVGYPLSSRWYWIRRWMVKSRDRIFGDGGVRPFASRKKRSLLRR